MANGIDSALRIGNLVLRDKAIGEPKNVVLNADSDLSIVGGWATAAQQNGSPCFMQINHPGQQIPLRLVATQNILIVK